jgi:hypothetical protein
MMYAFPFCPTPALHVPSIRPSLIYNPINIWREVMIMKLLSEQFLRFPLFFPLLLTYLFTELSPSWGAVNCAAPQEPPSISWNPKVQYRVHRSLSWTISIQSTPSHPISLKSTSSLSGYIFSLTSSSIRVIPAMRGSRFHMQKLHLCIYYFFLFLDNRARRWNILNWTATSISRV